MKKELQLQDYLDMVLRRRWLILAALAGVMAVTIIYSFSQPYIYQSGATLMLESKNVSFAETPVNYFQEPPKPIEYFRAIVYSRDFSSKLYKAVRDTARKLGAQGLLKEGIDAGRTGLMLNTGAYEDLVVLSATTQDPRLAFAMATKATELLKNQSMRLDREEYENAVSFIEEQKSVAQDKLEQTERDLQFFKDKHNILQVDVEGGQPSELMKLENELSQIQTQKELAQSNLSAYENKLRSIQRTIGTSGETETPETQAMREEIANLEADKDDKIRRLGPQHAEVLRAEGVIEAKKRALVNLIVGGAQDTGGDKSRDMAQFKTLQENRVAEEINVYVLSNREKYYQTQIAAFRRRHPDVVETTIEFIRLTRAKTVAENLYNFLLEKGEEAKIKAAAGSGGIRIVDAPTLPNGPLARGTVRRLMLGLILGLGLGCGAALLAEFLDHTIQNHEQISERLGLAVVGSVPAFKDLPKKTHHRKTMDPARTKAVDAAPPGTNGVLISGMNPKSPAVEAYRTIRANLQFSAVDTTIKTLVVTSPSPSEGKSVTSANLAIAFALLGDKVLLVDTDMRKPVLHELFSIQKSPGISDMLVEKMPLKNVIKNTAIPNLHVIASGTLPPNPAEILASKAMQMLLEKLKKDFALVIFDTPPVLPVSDAIILSSRTDGVLLVMRHQSTTFDFADQAIQSLKRGSAKILGAVFNNTRIKPGYGYYYRYYSKGYYSQ